LATTSGLQLQKKSEENMTYVAGNIQGLCQYGTEKVSTSSVRFYNAVTGAKIGLIRAGPTCTLCMQQWDFYTYQKVCATQHASPVPDGIVPVYKRFSMVHGVSLTTKWAITHTACDGEAGCAMWRLEHPSWSPTDNNFYIYEDGSELQVGAIFDKNGMKIPGLSSAPSTPTFDVWLADGQDLALGVLVAILTNLSPTLLPPDTPPLAAASAAPNPAAPATPGAATPAAPAR
jgi:hypothetical protein